MSNKPMVRLIPRLICSSTNPLRNLIGNDHLFINQLRHVLLRTAYAWVADDDLNGCIRQVCDQENHRLHVNFVPM